MKDFVGRLPVQPRSHWRKSARIAFNLAFTFIAVFGFFVLIAFCFAIAGAHPKP